ncbi:glucan endo-1,3-beta-glucosidase-like [Dorcoceras hygrometricum]|uniref:Glucan endo-1,3-beta-glucosidase-like n=1 Tax=Dorcoceras hygrometricum TaxID=472368 RepID=A0A2Z7C350_9LAMI|nr:glucan endo-1,3-beta-glucosidase-like [Dorcoceras hygrometricum]
MPTVTLGEGVPFPIAKILSMKTLNTYIATNTTIDAREEKGMVGEATVKRTPKSKKKSSSADDTPVKVIFEIAESKKRVATEDNAPAIPKEKGMVGEATVKRTPKSKKKSSSADDTPVKGPDFWRSSCRLSLFLNKTEMPVPAFHDIFVSTAVFIEPVQYWDAAPSLLKTWRWRDVFTEVIRFSMYGCLRPVCKGLVVYNLGVLFLNKTEMPAPALHDIFVSTDVLIEPVQYLDAAPSLLRTWRWRDVCTEVIRFSMYGCLHPVCKGLVVYNLGVERLPDYFLDDFQKGVCTDTFVSYFSGSSIQTNSEIGLSSSDGSTVYRSPSPISQEVDSFEHDLRFALGPAIFSSIEQEERLYFVQSPESPSDISPHQEYSSSSTAVSMHFDSTDIPVNAQADTQTSAPVDFTMFTDALEDLRSSIFQRIHDSNCEILSKVNGVELGVRGDLLKLQVLLRQSLENAYRVLERQGTTQATQINDLKKGLMAPVGTIFQDLFDIKKKQREQDAKLIALDGQIAAIRSEQLDFRTKIAADILSLSTQVGDIADYTNVSPNDWNFCRES